MVASFYRGLIRGKTRIVIAWIGSIAMGIATRDYPSIGAIVLCFAGATLRFWASGYLRKDTRPAVGGPYAFVRNPLYLGTYVMAVATAWATGNLLVLAVMTVTFAAIYHFIILDEEDKLKQIFGPPYLEYQKLVPRFFPRLVPPLARAKDADLRAVNPDDSVRSYSWELAMRNRAFEAYWSFLGLMGGVALIAYIRQTWFAG